MLRAGDVLSDRFEVEGLAASGGMGAVFRARDRTTSERVAVKVLRTSIWDELQEHEGRATEVEVPGRGTGVQGGAAPLDRAALHGHRERFLREARVLAQLAHPAIARYVAHGFLPNGAPFLVMEWLEGETLAQRLSRGSLTIAEAITVGKRVAEALAHAHAVGIVHRDVKPSNLLLAGGKLEDLELIDFGVARVVHAPDLTRTGLAIGTAGYMAPEQARGATDLDGRADLYALGAVLYRCLTGEVPFAGRDVLSVLAKVLLQPAPSVRATRADVPEELDALIGSLLAKEPSERPRDAEQVREALGGLKIVDGVPVSYRPSARLSGNEQRLVSLVVMGRADSALEPLTAPTLATVTIRRSPIEEVVERFGGRLERLADGAVVVVFFARGSGTDLAAQAARCALSLAPFAKGSVVSLATGRADVASALPVGDVIDRASAMLHEPEPGVHVDALTAGLLDQRFDVTEREDGQRVLVGEREGSEISRLLLGRPTPCVGRDRELASLEAILDECARDSVARAVVLTGAPGSGKSRIVHELLGKVRTRELATAVWAGRVDPMSAGAPLELARQVARSGLGVRPADTLAARRARIEEQVTRRVPAPDAARVTRFLGELLETPFDDDPGPEVLAARANPVLMGDQMRRAWEDLLRSECGRQPLLVVLEDLQWGDLSTVRWLDGALGQLGDAPLMLLALGRPEIDATFPRLWESHAFFRMSVPSLSKRASEQLVRHVLPNASQSVVDRVVSRAAGNAYFLEELIRHTSEKGGDAAVPETVLAMVQTQLETLDADARRVLRTGSLFGQSFRAGAVRYLLRHDLADAEVTAALERLALRELVRRRPAGGDEEVSFRQDLVREAAYASLTAPDRKAAHKLAARWLERSGDANALALAEHLERGGDPLRAAGWYQRAAELALEGNDFAQAIANAERGIACGPTGEALALAKRTLAVAWRWRGDAARSFDAAQEAFALAAPDGLPARSPLAYRAAADIAIACTRTARAAELRALAEKLLAARDPTDPALASALLSALAIVARGASALQERELTARLVARVNAVLATVERLPPDLAADVAVARATAAMQREDFEAYLHHIGERRDAHRAAGDVRGFCEASNSFGFACLVVGADERGEVALREGVEAAERLGLARERAACRSNLALILSRRGKLDEALAELRGALAKIRELGEVALLASAELDEAEILRLRGDLAAAEHAARAAYEDATRSPTHRVYSAAVLARVLLANGKEKEALTLSAWAYERRAELPFRDASDLLIDLAYGHALRANGRADDAVRVLSGARDAVLARAARFTDPALRESFLRVPENAAVLEER